MTSNLDVRVIDPIQNFNLLFSYTEVFMFNYYNDGNFLEGKNIG